MWLKVLFLSIFTWDICLTTSFDLRGVVSGNSMAAVPLGISLGSGELDVEGICTRPGMACLNCTHSITCVALPFGWLKVPLQECTHGQTCNAHIGNCSSDHVPECDGVSHKYKHTCEQVGIFPDAHDCRKFHLCSPPDGLPDGRPADHRSALCPRHYGYDPQTAQCSVPLKNGQCSQKPVPNCVTVGQSGALPSSLNHYYVCLQKNGRLYPQIFICPHGWYFYNGFCHPEKQEKNEIKPTENNAESKSSEEVTTAKPKLKVTTSKTESFFSTEKSTTHPADTFLADKFDLSNYEWIGDDDAAGYAAHDEFMNSVENVSW